MHPNFLSGLIAASVALTSFLTQLQHPPAKQASSTPSTSISTAPATPNTIPPVKSWKTISNQYVTFQYPSDWVLETKTTPSGTVITASQPTYPFTQGLPIFSMAITDKAAFDKQAHINSTITNFLDPYAPYSAIQIDGHSAKRTRLDLSHGRWIMGEDIALFVPEKNIFIKFGMTDVGINFDKQVTTWFNPLVSSLRIGTN